MFGKVGEDGDVLSIFIYLNGINQWRAVAMNISNTIYRIETHSITLSFHDLEINPSVTLPNTYRLYLKQYMSCIMT